jgi:CSLREA domain-containing protein
MRNRKWIATVGLVAALALPAVARADFTVNQAGDEPDGNLADTACDVSGDPGIQCSLRAAIQEANDTAGADVIGFALPGTAVTTLTPATSYPDLTSPMTISGYAQAGSAPNTQPFPKPLDTELRVEIDASAIPFELNSETFTFAAGSAPSTIQGLAVNGNPNSAFRSESGANATIRGNFIGTNADGTEAAPNGAGFFGSSGTTTIGGPNPADTNVISGNFDDGITTSPGLSIERNYIGVGADGKSPIPNGNPADIFSRPVGFFGTPNRLVQNIIAHNVRPPVVMFNSSTVTYISENRIYDNPGIGLDFDDNGVTQNDPLDADSLGPNELQNFPVVKKANAKSSTTKISAVLNSEANGNYRVELFEAKQKQREANRFLNSFAVTTDAEGHGKLKVEVGRRVKPGRFITATATDLSLGAEGGTSEFSKPRKVKRP